MTQEPMCDAILSVVSTYGEMWPGELSEFFDELNLHHTQTDLRDSIWHLIHNGKLELTVERKIRLP